MWRVIPSVSSLTAPTSTAAVLRIATASSALTTAAPTATDELLQTTTVTGTVLPTNLVCGPNGRVGSLEEGVGVGPVNNETWPQILTCCKGRAVTIFPGQGCVGWCEPALTFSELHECYLEPDGSTRAGITFIAFEDRSPVSTSSGSSVVVASSTCGAAFDGAATLPCSSAAGTTTAATSSSTPNGAASATKSQGFGKVEIGLTLLVSVSLLTGTLL